MKFRSTVFWPEKDVVANEIIDTAATDAKAGELEMLGRVAEGLAVEHVDPAPAEAETEAK